MKLTNKDVVFDCLAQIDAIQEHIRSVEAALYRARDLIGDRDGKLQATDLFAALHQAEMTAWRNLAMWGLTLDDADRARIKAACADRFLRPGMSVGRWLSRDGTQPSSYLVADEDEFRAMVARVFSPGA